MSKRLLFFCALTAALTASAQKSVQTVVLDNFVQDAKGKKMQSIIAVYKYAGQPFEDPINLGVETKKESGKFYAKLPDMQGVTDTSYAYVYFGGIDERKDLPGYSLVIIGNNKRSFKPALLWIDRNHNLDLSDDGAPDTFSSIKPDLDIVLRHPQIKNATYTVNISRFSFSYNSRYIGMLDDYYKENSGSKQFAGALYSFKEQRINTIAGDYASGGDSFRIGIKDVNCNGLYNDAGVDYILIGDYGSPVMPDNIIQINSKAGKTWFEKDGKRYNILNIDRLGARITIEHDPGARISNALVPGKKLKKFRFQTTDKEKRTVSIKKYRKKPTYIYVWRFDQPGFSADTAILRIIARDYSDRIHLVTLNYGETPKELKTFKRINGINWLIGQSTRKINDLMFIERFPFGLLTSKRLRIKQIKISPADLLLLLKNNQI